MGSKIKNIICYETNGQIDYSLIDSPKRSMNVFNVREKRMRKKASRSLENNCKICAVTRKINRIKRQSGAITMEEFVGKYLEISGPVLEQMKYLTHLELSKMGFSDVKRVPNEIVNGYGSEHLFVIDSSNYVLAYCNPKEKINNGILKNIIYKNKHTKCIPRQSFAIEYDECKDEEYYEIIEEELNREYNKMGENTYEKCKRR